MSLPREKESKSQTTGLANESAQLTENWIIGVLGNKEYERILAETLLKTRLSGQSSPGPLGFWRFINSSFVIWFLSTVILGGYVHYNQQQRISKEAVDEITRIDEELSLRLKTFWAGVIELSSKADAEYSRIKDTPGAKMDGYFGGLYRRCEEANYPRFHTRSDLSEINILGLTGTLRMLTAKHKYTPRRYRIKNDLEELDAILSHTQKAWLLIEKACIDKYYEAQDNMVLTEYQKSFAERIEEIKMVMKSHERGLKHFQ